MALIKRILVVSENQELSIFMMDVMRNQTFYDSLKVDFCYSLQNKDPQKMIAIGATLIDLKDAVTIERVLKNYDLIFSLHCKQIFPRYLVENIPCINFHPGFNPFNRGWFPQAFSIVNGMTAGSTIHLMDAEVDNGAIIAQKMVELSLSDTSLEAYRKVIQAEKDLINENIGRILNGNFIAIPPIEKGNYNDIKDFNLMCKLDLKSVGSLGDHINLLRATSHGNFKNAYFMDEFGKKYYIRVLIEEDH
jgi:dTDP-4-amino-4,6-dideoxyglucose formyltransferase